MSILLNSHRSTSSARVYTIILGRRAKVFVRDADGKYSFGTGVMAKLVQTLPLIQAIRISSLAEPVQ